jgi:homocitrate synthase NifV
MRPRKIIIRDSTLREGLDTPTVSFSNKAKLRIATLLDKAGVPELELAAPARLLNDLEFVKLLNRKNLKAKSSGLIYAYKPDVKQQIEEAARVLDRFDLLMPVSFKREPFGRKTKIELLSASLAYALRRNPDVGAGFPHATQADVDFLLEISVRAAKNGAKRLTIYDTNGSVDPFHVHALISKIAKKIKVPIFFHAHDDLGLATANSLAAILGGASGLDVTVNSLGDRAGNASLEQAVLNLSLMGFETGFKLGYLRKLSEVVEKESGIPVSKIAPVVGKYIFSHKSPAHLNIPKLFEAYNPACTGFNRRLTNE